MIDTWCLRWSMTRPRTSLRSVCSCPHTTASSSWRWPDQATRPVLGYFWPPQSPRLVPRCSPSRRLPCSGSLWVQDVERCCPPESAYSPNPPHTFRPPPVVLASLRAPVHLFFDVHLVCRCVAVSAPDLSQIGPWSSINKTSGFLPSRAHLHHPD